MENIIIAGPTHFGILHQMQVELSSLGYNTQDFFISEFKFKYKNLGQRLYNLYRKTILGDYTYKESLRAKAPIEYLTEKLNKLQPAEYGLVIRPDMYPIEILHLLRQKVDTLIAYQWDGLDRYPDVLSRMDIFDKFYIFDPADAKYPNVLPTTNFHMNIGWESNTCIDQQINKVYYVGSFEHSRWTILSELIEKINRIGVEQEILVATYTDEQHKIAQQNQIINLLETQITYQENLQKLQNCSVLIDLQNDVHNGISFRLFEAIGYDKKVITTNQAVQSYDFYAPERILIWNNQLSIQELSDFIHAPNTPYAPEIKRKYSLNNWIKYMLDQKGHIPITFPAIDRFSD